MKPTFTILLLQNASNGFAPLRIDRSRGYALADREVNGIGVHPASDILAS
jgi:hypothetical protein